MRQLVRRRGLITLLIAFAVVAASCSSSTDDTTTTTQAVAAPETTTTQAPPPETTTTTEAAQTLGTAENPIKVLFVPSVDAQVITTGGEIMAEALNEATGYEFEVAVPTSYSESQLYRITRFGDFI